MKIRVAPAVTVFIAMAVGLALGVLFQEYYGIESMLDFLGGDPSSLLPKTARSEDVIPEEYQGKLHLFILAGQSNMSGWGDLPQTSPTPDPRIYLFGNDYRWKLAADPVDDPADQVDRVSEDLEAGFGPALPFALALVERDPDMVIGLIPCATGNSSIYEWQRSLGDGTLYGSCLKRTRAASTMGNVAGLLFFQGEADALDPKQYRKRTLLPDQWGEYFAVLVNDWRTDLDSPELPVVFAQIANTTTPEKYPNWEIVQEQQAGVRLPFVAMITTDDLALQDPVHFTTESYRIVGKRFAEAFLELLEAQPE
jgi:hypothetical protein